MGVRETCYDNRHYRCHLRPDEPVPRSQSRIRVLGYGWRSATFISRFATNYHSKERILWSKYSDWSVQEVLCRRKASTCVHIDEGSPYYNIRLLHLSRWYSTVWNCSGSDHPVQYHPLWILNLILCAFPGWGPAERQKRSREATYFENHRRENSTNDWCQ